LIRVFELQKRRLLHVHPVLGHSTLAEKAGADRYLEHLDALADHYGFGFIERKHRIREPRAAAAYLSSYFIKGKGNKISRRGVGALQLDAALDHSRIEGANPEKRDHDADASSAAVRLDALACDRCHVWKLCCLDAHDLWCAFRQDVTLSAIGC
jgi:hypothetical protein